MEVLHVYLIYLFMSQCIGNPGGSIAHSNMLGKGKLEYLHNENVPLPKKLKASLLRMGKDENEALALADGDRRKCINSRPSNYLDTSAMASSYLHCATSLELNSMLHVDGKSVFTSGGNFCERSSYNETTVTDSPMCKITETIPMDTEELIEQIQHGGADNILNENDFNDLPHNTHNSFMDTFGITGDFSSCLQNHDSYDVSQDGYFSDGDEAARKETENFFESLKSAGRNPDPVQNLPTSVKISTEKDPRMLMLMALNLSLKHMLSFSAIVGLLMLLNFVCDAKVLPETRYSFDKFYNTNLKYDLHSVCPFCTEYCGTFSTREVTTCSSCGNAVDMTNPSNKCFFVIFDPSEPVRDYLQMNEDYYDGIMNSRMHEKNHLKDFYDGKIYRKFRSRLSPSDKNSYATFILNTDGVPLYESSGCSVWPIYLMLNEIPPQKRFDCLILAGLWVGRGKPVMDVFLDKFVTQMNQLSTEGITCTIKGEKRQIKLFTLQCSVDTIARFPMNGTKQFNARFGCDWCLQEGIVPRMNPNDNSRVYPYEYPLEKRTRENTLLFAQEALRTGEAFMGVTSPSPLLNMKEFDIIDGFSPEYMHQYLAGVVAQLTDFIISGLSSIEFEELNRLLTSIRVPNQIGRLSRSLKFRSEFKCKEWENWALYYSVPLLSKLMKNRAQLKHWCLLVNSLHMSLKMDISYQDLNKISEMLHLFVQDVTKYYPLKALTYNVHQLLHIAESICNWGPLWTHSAFAFESANRKLLASIHSEKGIILQIIRYSNLFRFRQILEDLVYPNSSDIERAYCDNMLGALNEKVVKLSSATYFGDGESVSRAFAVGYNISEQVLSYKRAFINGCLFMTSEKENVRTCNYYARLKNGRFIKIMKFLIDFDDRIERTECRSLRVRKLHLSDFIYEIVEVDNREELVSTDEIDYPCVFVQVGVKGHIVPVPNKLSY